MGKEEKVKVTLYKYLIEFGFRETVIFEDEFDFVLRKGSIYILVRISASQYKTVHQDLENLDYVRGFRERFFFILITDEISEKESKMLELYDFQYLTFNDILVESKPNRWINLNDWINELE